MQVKINNKKLKDAGDLKEITEEIFPHIKGILMVNGSDNTFDEMTH